jgi:hypothetical protein
MRCVPSFADEPVHHVDLLFLLLVLTLLVETRERGGTMRASCSRVYERGWGMLERLGLQLLPHYIITRRA